jgi:tight adherence protein B
MNPLACWRQKRRHSLVARQLRITLQTLVHSLRTGTSFLQALERAAREGDEPLAGEWRRMLRAIQIGGSLPQALTELEQRVPVREFGWFVMAVRISQETGGSLSAILDSLANSCVKRSPRSRRRGKRREPCSVSCPSS